jgi:AraC-like DNA-binding protein
MKVMIKNMVCGRCIKVVKEEFEKMGYSVNEITLGEVEIDENPDKAEMETIRNVLLENGFELIENKSAKLIEKIKTTIINYVHYSNEDLEMNLSQLMESKLDKDYSYLSTLFSSAEGITLEHYFILQKIERAKELLKYDDLTLSEIAYKLGYYSVNHLSTQFKKITGMTASNFKKHTSQMRKPLDNII